MAAAEKRARQTADQFLKLTSVALIGGAYELILSRGIQNYINAMEPHHMQKLIDLGLVYDRLGPDIEYHGTRTPFESNITKVLKNTAENHPFIREILSAEGRNEKFNDQLFPQESSSSTRFPVIAGYVTPLKPAL